MEHNEKKTVFMILNLTKSEAELAISKEIEIGGSMVQRSCSTKLLGVEIDEKQDWKEHFNSLLNSLNKRTFAIRRISNKIPKIEVIKVVQSIWMSKLRYGLQLCNQVRTNTEDPTNSLMKSVQVAQNKMLRMLDRISLKDHVTSKSLLLKYNLSSVNQLAAEIKLLESWKSVNLANYPFQLERNNTSQTNNDRVLRLTSIKFGKDEARSKAASKNISRDCAKLWNNAPMTIKNASTLWCAKKEIKSYCRSLEL